MTTPSRHANARNIVAEDRTFFVTSSTWGKRNFLQSARMAELFVEVLYDYRDQHKYLLHEFVVMPDHFHALISVAQDTSIERAVQFIKGGFAFRAGRELGVRMPIWQKGFSEIRVRDREALLKIRKYIHNNPVRRQLAQDARAYEYSSANQRYRVDPEPQRLKPFPCEQEFGVPEGTP